MKIGDIHERHKAWDSKKNLKIEILKNKEKEKEIEECNFKPKLVKFKKNYFERQNKMRLNKYLTAKKENTKPGSGNYFSTRSKSKPRLLDRVLITDLNESKRSEVINIKSLDKVKLK